MWRICVRTWRNGASFNRFAYPGMGAAKLSAVLQSLLTRLRAIRSGRLFRPAKRTAAALAITYLVYLIGVNATLLRRHFDIQEQVHVTYTSCWSWFPGKLRAHGVRIVGTDSHVEWQLDVERVSLDVSLVALFHRRFRASDIHGSGLSMKMRRKLAPTEATPAVVASLPPIAGHPDPPIKPPVPSPPIPDAEYDLWSVQLEDADADPVREVWIDAYHFTGDARARGSFVLRPVRMASVGPSTIDVRSGELQIYGESALDGLTGRLDATLAPFDPREVEGASVLRSVTAGVQGDGHVVSVGFLKHYGDATPAVVLEGGAGSAHVDLRIDAGVLAAPSLVTLDTDLLRADASDHHVTSAAHVAFIVDALTGSPEARLAIDLSRVTLHHGDAKEPLLEAARIIANGRSAEVDLVRPFGDVTASLDWPDVVFPDLRRLDVYFGKGASPIRGGTGRTHGELHASLPKRHVTGHAAATASGLVLHLGSTDARGSVSADVALAGLDLDSGRGDVSGSRIDARDVVLSSAPKEPGWWASAQLADAHLSIAPAHLRTKLALQAKDGRPILEQGVPKSLANLIGLDGLHGGAALALGPSQVDLTGLRVEGKGGDVRAELYDRGAKTYGVAMVNAGLLKVGVELEGHNTSFRLFATDEWYAHAAATAAAEAGPAKATGTTKQSAL